MCNKFTNFLYRFCFVVAGLMLLVGAVDWFMRLFGWTFCWVPYEPGRLFELAAVVLIFVIALELRQIKDALSK